jgi:hypothetical protein
VNSEITIQTTSEDIQIIDDNLNKYLVFKDEIRNIIRDSNQINKKIIENTVDGFINLLEKPGLTNIFPFVKKSWFYYKKSQKLKCVIENLLDKIFDVTLGWYIMDYMDLKDTCDCYGGKDFFSRDDHRHIYISIIQQLKRGPIRDKCIQMNIENFINDKIRDINDNYLEFKQREL